MRARRIVCPANKRAKDPQFETLLRRAAQFQKSRRWLHLGDTALAQKAGVSESEPHLPARILIVDDNTLVRQAIRSLLHAHSFQVCEEATNGKEAVEQVHELKPDIVLLDINMPVMGGFDAAREIRRISPESKIVFLTMFGARAVMRHARLWADGSVSKYCVGRELIPTLMRLIQDQTPPPEAL